MVGSHYPIFGANYSSDLKTEVRRMNISVNRNNARRIIGSEIGSCEPTHTL